MPNAEPGAGDVPIVLAGEDLNLSPSLDACRSISRMAGDSLGQAIARCNRLDFDFIVEVVALGLNATSPTLKKQIQDKVYQTGVIAIAADCILFIRTIMNGGKRPSEDAAAASLEMLDKVATMLPEGLDEHAGAIEALRGALVAKIEEAGQETEDPLAESGSPSENSTAS
jgi:hypothetical protein